MTSRSRVRLITYYTMKLIEVMRQLRNRSFVMGMTTLKHSLKLKAYYFFDRCSFITSTIHSVTTPLVIQ